jgi:hypothetical protein
MEIFGILFNQMSSDQLRIAKALTIAGHPLVLGNLYVIFMALYYLTQKEALLLSALILCGITLPICLHNYRKLRLGKYTNFDVSDRQQRKGFYPFAIFVLSITAGLIWYKEFPLNVSYQILWLCTMIGCLALLNYRIKASLHAALAFFISCNFFVFGMAAALLMGGLALGISWSRFILGRHSISELVAGGIVGLVFGLLAYNF